VSANKCKARVHVASTKL